MSSGVGVERGVDCWGVGEEEEGDCGCDSEKAGGVRIGVSRGF